LVGPRILLRKLRRLDAPALAKAAHDREIYRNTWIPFPYTLDDAYDFIKKAEKFWEEGTAYPFTIVWKETGEIAGGIGLQILSRRHASAELGYWIARKRRRQGVVSEAIALTLAWGFEDLKLHRIQAHVIEGNEASVGVLNKAGFTYEGIVRDGMKHHGRWKNLHRFSMLKGDWKR